MIAPLFRPHRSGLRASLPAIILAIGAMVSAGGALAADATYPTPEQAITQTCADTAAAVDAPPEDCSAITTAIIGQANGTTLHFARYCLDDTVKHVGEFCILQGMAVLAESLQSGQTTLLFETDSDTSETYQPPMLLDSPYGTILDIQDTVAGTGNYNESQYLLLKDKQWQPIDSTSWLNDLQARIPKGTEINKGVWPDLVNMQAQTYLYKPGDANCCPTAGTADIELELVGTQLAIKSLTVGPAPEH